MSTAELAEILKSVSPALATLAGALAALGGVALKSRLDQAEKIREIARANQKEFAIVLGLLITKLRIFEIQLTDTKRNWLTYKSQASSSADGASSAYSSYQESHRTLYEMLSQIIEVTESCVMHAFDQSQMIELNDASIRWVLTEIQNHKEHDLEVDVQQSEVIDRLSALRLAVSRSYKLIDQQSG